MSDEEKTRDLDERLREVDALHDLVEVVHKETRDAVVHAVVLFLVDAGCEAAASMVEIEFGRPPGE